MWKKEKRNPLISCEKFKKYDDAMKKLLSKIKLVSYADQFSSHLR